MSLSGVLILAGSVGILLTILLALYFTFHPLQNPLKEKQNTPKRPVVTASSEDKKATGAQQEQRGIKKIAYREEAFVTEIIGEPEKLLPTPENVPTPADNRIPAAVATAELPDGDGRTKPEICPPQPNQENRSAKQPSGAESDAKRHRHIKAGVVILLPAMIVIAALGGVLVHSQSKSIEGGNLNSEPLTSKLTQPFADSDEISLEEQVVADKNGFKATAIWMDSTVNERGLTNYIIYLKAENNTGKDIIVKSAENGAMVNGYVTPCLLEGALSAQKGYGGEITLHNGQSAVVNWTFDERYLKPTKSGEKIPFQCMIGFDVYEWNGIALNSGADHIEDLGYERKDLLFTTDIAEIKTFATGKHQVDLELAGDMLYRGNDAEISYAGTEVSKFNRVEIVDGEEIKETEMYTYWFVYEVENKSDHAITVKVDDAKINGQGQLEQINSNERAEIELTASSVFYPNTVGTINIYIDSDVLEQIGIESIEDLSSLDCRIKVCPLGNEESVIWEEDVLLLEESLQRQISGTYPYNMF